LLFEVFSTDIWLNVAPHGTVTDRESDEEAVTVALTAPKKTILFAGVALKLLPLIEIVDEGDAAPGKNEFIVGTEEVWAATADDKTEKIMGITKREFGISMVSKV